MDINEASKILSNLLSKANSKSEKRVYNCFLKTLTFLENNDLPKNEQLMIQEKLTTLQLTDKEGNTKKHYAKKLTDFKSFLKKEFSYTTEKHYTELGVGLGMSLGISLGISIGVAIDPSIGISMGITFGSMVGMMIGMIYGTKKDAEAKKIGKSY